MDTVVLWEYIERNDMVFKTIAECLLLNDKAECATQGTISRVYEPKQITGSGQHGDYAFWTQSIMIKDASGGTLVNGKIAAPDARMRPGQYFVGTNMAVNEWKRQKSLRGEGVAIDLPGCSAGGKSPDMRDLSIARMNAFNRICEIFTLMDGRNPMFDLSTTPALIEDMQKEAEDLVHYFFNGITDRTLDNSPEPDVGEPTPPEASDIPFGEEKPPASSQGAPKAKEKKSTEGWDI